MCNNLHPVGFPSQESCFFNNSVCRFSRNVMRGLKCSTIPVANRAKVKRLFLQSSALQFALYAVFCAGRTRPNKFKTYIMYPTLMDIAKDISIIQVQLWYTIPFSLPLKVQVSSSQYIFQWVYFSYLVSSSDPPMGVTDI